MDEITSTAANNVSSAYLTATASRNAQAAEKKTDAAEAKPAEEKKGAIGQEAASYEKSADADTVQDKAPAKRTDADRTALIAQMKDDMEKQKSQLLEIVRKTMSGQGSAFAIATDDDSLWHKLANGDFTVDEAAKAQAQKDIADDGYWGVDKTSDRILDFAKALSGDDPAKADQLLDAFKKGYDEATKSWGKDLPDISKRTYDAVVEKFDKWKQSAEGVTETTPAAQEAAATASVVA